MGDENKTIKEAPTKEVITKEVPIKYLYKYIAHIKSNEILLSLKTYEIGDTTHGEIVYYGESILPLANFKLGKFFDTKTALYNYEIKMQLYSLSEIKHSELKRLLISDTTDLLKEKMQEAASTISGLAAINASTVRNGLRTIP